MIRRLLCALGLHAWDYEPNAHGGRPMFRRCSGCGERHVWDYEAARCRGVIIWRKY